MSGTERVLVIGGTGLVGGYLVREWESRGAPVAAATYHCRPSPLFRQLDMEDPEAVLRLIDEVRPGVIAVPAANPHVDHCELHPEETRRVNVQGTLHVARVCAEAGARMVFYSSDYVFDGARESYSEDDAVCPINEYGRQKAEAEAGVLAASSRNLVLRTSGAYGWQSDPKNFVLQLRQRLGAGERFRLAGEMRYNPSYAADLAAVTAELVSREAAGIYHAVGRERIRRLEFARMVCRRFGLDESLLEPVAAAEFKAPAPRPRESSLRTDKLARLGLVLRGPEDGLRHMAEDEPAWSEFSRRLPQKAGNLLQ